MVTIAYTSTRPREPAVTEWNGRTVRDLRRGSRAAVLRALYVAGALTRQQLAPATGLSSGSISNVVAELLAEGVVEDAGAIGSESGRRRGLLRVVPGYGCVIGVDVGETRVRAGLFDLTLREVARTERLLTEPGYQPERIAGHVRDAVAGLLRDTGAPPDRLLGVGVGVPGQVTADPVRGAVVHGQTVGWDAVPFEALIRAGGALPRTAPIHVDNGALTLGLAETWPGGTGLPGPQPPAAAFGAAEEAPPLPGPPPAAHPAGAGESGPLVLALLGSGVGACVLPGGAVEWGHTTVQVGGRRCRCGARGCLEAYVGAQAVLDRWRAAGGTPPPDADQETRLAALLAAARPPGRGRRTDPAAVGVLAETAEYLGAGIASLANLFAPERVVLAGWAGLLLGPRLLPAVRRHARAHALRRPGGPVRIELSVLGAEAVTQGAATLPLAAFLEQGAATVRPALPGPGGSDAGEAATAAPAATATPAAHEGAAELMPTGASPERVRR
jgi:predicted NBD/HSP70 family sugar kinase